MRTAGIETGPISGLPPPVSADTMADLLTSTKNDPLGQHESGKDGDGREKEGKDDEKQGMDSLAFSQERSCQSSWRVDTRMYVCMYTDYTVCTISSNGRLTPSLLLGNDRKNSKEMKGPLASATSAAEG